MICVCHGLLPCDRAPLDEQFKGLERETALAPGFEQQSDGALQGEADRTGCLPGVLVVDEYPVRRLLLAKYNNLNLASIKRLPPGGQR